MQNLWPTSVKKVWNRQEAWYGARTDHVPKETVNNSVKKKPQRKRRVTVNLAATKYDVGKSKLQLSFGSVVHVGGDTSKRKIDYICSSCT